MKKLAIKFVPVVLFATLGVFSLQGNAQSLDGAKKNGATGATIINGQPATMCYCTEFSASCTCD